MAVKSCSWKTCLLWLTPDTALPDRLPPGFKEQRSMSCHPCATKNFFVGLVAALYLSEALLGAEFNRQSFLTAVKDHIKAQPALMKSDSRSWRGIAVVTPVSEAFRQYQSNEPPGE